MKRKYSTDRLVLEVLEPKDAQLVVDYYTRNKAFLSNWEPSRNSAFYTKEHHEQLLESSLQAFQEGNRIPLWIFKKEEYGNRVIGCVNISNIIRACFLSCFIGYKCDQEELRQGYMKEAVDAVIDIVFKEYQLHRIEANIIPRNEASIALVKSLGFQYEGLAERYLKINGVWEDHQHYSITSEKRGVNL